MKKIKQKRRTWSERGLEAARSLDLATGNGGIEVTIGSEATGGISHYFTNKLPPLKITTHNLEREVSVEMSSVEQDNKKLLHYLFSRVVEHRD